MGTWNAGIFDDDIALDIKAEFDDALAEGMTVKEATKQILESFEDVLEDDEESPIVYLALAALQLEKGEIQKNIKKKALQIIESEQGMERWEEAGAELFVQRKVILNELKRNLVQR